MRRWVILLATAASLSGCGDRRTFDQRYRDTDQQMSAQAQAMDNALAAENLAAPEKKSNGAGR